MTNLEKHKKEILYIAKNNAKMAVSKKSLKPQFCIDTECTQCLFNPEDCDTAPIEWFCQEYQDPAPKLTKKERIFCEIVRHGYIARDKDGSLCVYDSFPDRGTFIWSGGYWFDIVPDIFQFITWESNKSWSIESLLKLEVADE